MPTSYLHGLQTMPQQHATWLMHNGYSQSYSHSQPSGRHRSPLIRRERSTACTGRYYINATCCLLKKFNTSTTERWSARGFPPVAMALRQQNWSLNDASRRICSEWPRRAESQPVFYCQQDFLAGTASPSTGGWEGGKARKGQRRVQAGAEGQTIEDPQDQGETSEVEFAKKEASWLQQELLEQLTDEGNDPETSADVSNACAEALEQLLLSGLQNFDPLVLMDALEEGVERRGARGDFLPFELGQKAAQLVFQKWEGSQKPPQFERKFKENKLDMLDLNALPTAPLSGAGRPSTKRTDFDIFDADAAAPPAPES